MKASEICKEAATLVAGDRNQTHGPKLRNMENIAALWTTYLKIRRDPEVPLTGADVASMMVLLKVARMELGAFNIDDPIDGAGYMAIRGEVDPMAAA